MTQKEFNSNFKKLYLKYSELDKEKGIDSLLNELFYHYREPLKFEDINIKGEFECIKSLLEEHIDFNNRTSFMLRHRSLCTQYGWDNASYEQAYNEKELDYISIRDTNISIIFYMFAIYSQVQQPIETPHPIGIILTKLISTKKFLELDGFVYDNKTSLLFINCILDCLESSSLLNEEKERISVKIKKLVK